MRSTSEQFSLDHGLKVEARSWSQLEDLHCRSVETDNQFDEAELITPVLLGGGSGTRLWPLSRELQPKQFVQFNGEMRSFFSATLQRLAGTSFASPIIMCNKKHRFLVREEAERAGIFPRAIILEPVSRNTAMAIAVAATYLHDCEPESIMAVVPSDHRIDDDQRFRNRLRTAGKLAAQDKLVLFGVKPTEPHTGYGYLHQGTAVDDSNGDAFHVTAFLEKPNREAAEEFIAAGGYLWNSGVFVMRAKTVLRELEVFAPTVLEAARVALAKAEEDGGFLRLNRSALEAAPNLSIDHAVMEKTSNAVLLPLDCGWSDVGSWSSVWDISHRDERDNSVSGDALLEDTSCCCVYSNRGLVATLGIRDLVIVNTPDALLVADKNRARDVSQIVRRLKQSNRREHAQHLRNLRPWGYFESLIAGTRFQVKLLNVKPGAKLSLQMHHHRSEHWTVVHGTAKIVIGNTERLLCENESIYVPATHWHRLENPGKVPLEVIEVQIGSYLAEDDIVRSDDIYSRSPEETY
jgi:mannose-1-phosphate guanylyltransferase / mannose-6-phosphate isomerase